MYPKKSSIKISQFECHSILQTLSYYEFIDEVQLGVECMLSRITLCSCTPQHQDGT